MIELDLELPLAAFRMAVRAELPGTATVVMGPSGAGKTSLLEAIAGLRSHVRGHVRVGGVTFQDRQGTRLPPERRGVGYVPQDAGLFPHLTALENVRFGARASDDVDAAVELLGLGGALGRRPAALSGGERQRVALARALATRPRLLLLDEPLASLDIGLRERILPYLMSIRDARRVPLVYVTHNPGEALSLGERVLLLRAGRVEAAGAPLELLASPELGAAEEGLENILRGRIAAHDAEGGVTRVALDAGGSVAIGLAAERRVGDPVALAIRAEDVLVARRAVEGLSARNVYPAQVVWLARSGADITLRCALREGGEPWLVRVTPAAARALELAVGSECALAVKSHSVRLLAGATGGPTTSS